MRDGFEVVQNPADCEDGSQSPQSPAAQSNVAGPSRSPSVEFKRETSVNVYEVVENPSDCEDASQSSRSTGRNSSASPSRSPSREQGHASDLGTSRSWSSSLRKSLSPSRTSILGTFSIPDNVFSARSPNTDKSRSYMSKTEWRNHHRSRRGFGPRALTPSEMLDNAADEIVVKTIQQPYCLRSCMDKPACQKACFPADYATRNRQKRDGVESEGKRTKTSDLNHFTHQERRFGLPELTQAGYFLVPPEEVPWADRRVPIMLGLTLAIHRKTSIERYCLAFPKDKIPAHTTKDNLISLIKTLKRCDHLHILKLHEACENETTVYLLYEFVEGLTLLTVLENHAWTQSQVVNVVRECCAAVAYAASIKLDHMGWTLNHVLLPPSSMHANPEPEVLKIVGFGLHGVLYVDTSDQMCWSPEAVAAWHKNGAKFVHAMDPQMKMFSDCWSLGVIIYTLVARRPPILGSPKIVEELILAHKWAFTLAFDEVDSEARMLVEGLLHSSNEHRLLADLALKNEWIRRRSTHHHPLRAAKEFLKAEEFVQSPLPKRLFGRFLVKFLDAENLRQIARHFSELDVNGDGIICQNDMMISAKLANSTNQAAHVVSLWFSGGHHTGISIWQFAESMAEDVIDGRALRHAFESLDDDGSESICAEELFEALSMYDAALTKEQVMEHIVSAENHAGMHAADEPDHRIDFDEFEALFPVRFDRLKKLEERKNSTKARGQELGSQLQEHSDEVQAWITSLETQLAHVTRISSSSTFDKDAGSCVKQLIKHVKIISDALKAPPGRIEAKKMPQAWMELAKNQQRSHHHKPKKKTGAELLSFDSFLQDQAFAAFWPQHIASDGRNLKQSLVTDRQKMAEMNLLKDGAVDHCKAHDAAESMKTKLELIIHWAKDQFEEYQSIADVLGSALEPELPRVNYSSRGLQRLGEDGDDNDPQAVLDDRVDEKSSAWDCLPNFSSTCTRVEAVQGG